MGKLSERERIYIKNRILNVILNNPKRFSKKEISEIFGLSKRTIESYIKEFSENGYNIKIIDGKVAINSFGDRINLQYIKSNKEDIKKILILSCMNRSKDFLSIDKLAKKIINNGILNTEDTKYIKKLIGELEKDGYIYKEKNKIKIHGISSDILKRGKEEDFLVFLSLIKDIVQNSVAINRIYNKILWVQPNFDPNIIVGGIYGSFKVLDEEIINRVEESILTGRAVEIKYLSKEGVSTYKVKINNIIYSNEKESWYLICSQYKNRKMVKLELRTDKVIFLELVNEIYIDNNCRNDIDYENSIIISREKPCNIKVKFAKKEFIYTKLYNYCKNRKNANIEEFDNEYILTDMVNGILEFKEWVNSFGRAAEVLEPQLLKNKVIHDIQILEERYKNNG